MAQRIPVFLSVGEPHNDAQRQYLRALAAHLSRRGVIAETLGRSFWSIENPLKPVQRKMQGMYGAVVLAMESFHSLGGAHKGGSLEEELLVNSISRQSGRISRLRWLTSSSCRFQY